MTAPMQNMQAYQHRIARHARRLLNGRSRELARLARTDIDSAWRLAWQIAREEMGEKYTTTENN